MQKAQKNTQFPLTMINFRQLNVGKRAKAWAKLSHSLHSKEFNIALIQEPPRNKNKISSKLKDGVTFYKETNKPPRTCIHIDQITAKHTNAILLSQFSDSDHTTVHLKIIDGNKKQSDIIISSTYMPGLSEKGNNIVSDILLNLIIHCATKKIELIVGCDSNAHHSLWNSMKTDKRGENLVDFISYNIVLINQGNKATFCSNDNRNVQSHIDITLSTQNISKLIKKWEVSDEDSMSDHRAINFSMDFNVRNQEEIMSKRKTNWNKYKKESVSDCANFPDIQIFCMEFLIFETPSNFRKFLKI